MHHTTLQNDAPADGFADCHLLGNGALGAVTAEWRDGVLSSVVLHASTTRE